MILFGGLEERERESRRVRERKRERERERERERDKLMGGGYTVWRSKKTQKPWKRNKKTQME